MFIARGGQNRRLQLLRELLTVLLAREDRRSHTAKVAPNVSKSVASAPTVYFAYRTNTDSVNLRALTHAGTKDLRPAIFAETHRPGRATLRRLNVDFWLSR